MCMRTSLVERTPGTGRHAKVSAGVASASATSCRETCTHSPSYPCQRPSRESTWAGKAIVPRIVTRNSVFMLAPYLEITPCRGRPDAVLLNCLVKDEAFHPDACLQRAYRCGAVHLARPDRSAARKHGTGTC